MSNELAIILLAIIIIAIIVLWSRSKFKPIIRRLGWFIILIILICLIIPFYLASQEELPDLSDEDINFNIENEQPLIFPEVLPMATKEIAQEIATIIDTKATEEQEIWRRNIEKILLDDNNSSNITPTFYASNITLFNTIDNITLTLAWGYMDDGVKEHENQLLLNTHDVIITKIHELEKRINLRFDQEELKITALKDSIARQDEANLIRFDSVNNFRESLNDQLDRCATKEEMRLEITKEVATLEKALNKEAASLNTLILNNVNTLEKAINSYKTQQQAMWAVIIVAIGALIIDFVSGH